MPWKEIQPQQKGDKKPKYDWEANPELMGRLIGKEPSTFNPNSFIYKIQEKNGNVTTIFGTTVLDSRLANVKIGSKVKIQFDGLRQSTKGKPYKLFRVFTDDIPKEEEEMDEAVEKMPF